jgi:hypothetical protein
MSGAIWTGAAGRPLANRKAKIRDHLGGNFHRGSGLELTADQSVVELDHDALNPESGSDTRSLGSASQA